MTSDEFAVRPLRGREGRNFALDGGAEGGQDEDSGSVMAADSIQRDGKGGSSLQFQPKEHEMPAVMEAIDRMSPDERVQTMEYLWAAMTAAAEPEPPAWHGDVLAERRRRAAAGEETFIPLDEAMRQVREEVACR